MTPLEQKALLFGIEDDDGFAVINTDKRDGFLAGYTEALRWRDVKEELPENSEKVLCKMKSNEEVISGVIYFDGKYKIATEPCLHFEDYADYEVSHWRPI